MNCLHARIKVLDREDGEAFCWDCKCTVFIGSIPLDLRHPYDVKTSTYDTPRRGRVYKPVKL